MERKIHKAILENLPFAYAMHKIILDDCNNPVDYEYIEANEAFERFTGFNINYILGKRVTEILPNITTGSFNWINYYGNIAINGGESDFEQYSEDLKKWYKVKVFSPAIGYFITFFIDITQELKEKNLYKSILSSMEEGLLATDADGNITMINDAAKRITGLNKEGISKEEIKGVYNKIRSVISEGNVIKDEEVVINHNLDDDNKDINLIYNIYPIKNENGVIDGTVVSFMDVTEEVEKQNKIDYITYHDSLTGLYNRTFFTNEIKNIDTAENLPISIIMGDVNGLKLTNDAFGHLLGDKLLILAANAIKNSCRENDIVVRWGGDEFIVILPKTDEEQAQRISGKIKKESGNQKIDPMNLSISLGYSIKNNIEEDIMKTISNSEEMMYRIKMIESKSHKSKTVDVIQQTLKQKSIQDVEHSKNVSKICTIIGKEIGMSRKELSELEVLGDIHDIGKVTISTNILNKADTLNSEEWEEVKKHSEVGYHIALSSPDLSFLADSILCHHEKYDGSGYPKGLKGEKIPLYSRILSIADAFDSMAGFRTYKKKMTQEQIINEFKKCSGTQFDPKLVKDFIDKIIENKWIQEKYFNYNSKG